MIGNSKVPLGYYYDESTDEFRDITDDCFTSAEFYKNWRHHKALFPQSREAARKAYAEASPSPEEMEHALRFSHPFVMPEEKEKSND
jgi:hypothetical protein